MRVLFALYSEKTHLQPMVPLAWALRLAGHEVRVASQPALTDLITQAGLPAVAVGADHNLWRVARRFLTRRVAETRPEIYDRVRGVRQPPFDVVGLPPEQITWDRLAAGYHGIVRSWYRMVNDPMIEDLVAFARAWQPDLVVWEAATYAGPIAAKAVGAAQVRLLCNLDIFGVTRDHYLRLKRDQPPDRRGDPLAEWLGAGIARFGGEFSEDMTTGQYTIDQHPASLRMEADLRYLPMRFVPYNGAAVVPRWLWDPPRRPRVCLTLGSTSTEEFDGYPVSVREIVDALADLDIELVATLPDQERQRLARRPVHTTIVPFVALHLLAPTCAAVIHHGACGTATTTAAAGVPQLSLPERHDAPYQAERMVRFGAGLAVDFREATGEIVRDHLTRLLTEPAFAERARDLRAEMLAMPDPGELVTRLETIVAESRGCGQGSGVAGPVDTITEHSTFPPEYTSRQRNPADAETKP